MRKFALSMIVLSLVSAAAFADNDSNSSPLTPLSNAIQNLIPGNNNSTTPPGLAKQGKTPPGLAKKNKTPPGWSKGKKNNQGNQANNNNPNNSPTVGNLVDKALSFASN